MTTEEILHKLRNPYRLTYAQRQKVMLAAADEIERWKKNFENLQAWCDKNGWDTIARNR